MKICCRVLRPNNLLIITMGSRTWSASIESKIGNAELRRDQLEEYLDLAREVGIDAVITISNQEEQKVGNQFLD